MTVTRTPRLGLVRWDADTDPWSREDLVETIDALEDLIARREDLPTVSVHEHGATGDGITDDTTAITNAIAAARALGAGVVYLPEGTYLVDTIALPNRLVLRGANKHRTTIKAKAGSAAPALITLPAGPVQGARLEDLRIVGNGNANQRGIHLTATGSGGVPNHGGLWESGLHRIEVRDFAGDNIRLTGGGGAGYDFLLPHQFITFDEVFSYASATGHALYTEGQVGQLVVKGGQFDGAGKTAGTTVTTNVRLAAYSVTFIGTTFQSNRTGIYADGTSGLNLSGCYFEDLGVGVEAVNHAVVTVTAGHFGNVGSIGDGTGAIFKADSYALITVTGCKYTGDVERHYYVHWSGSAAIIPRGNSAGDASATVTTAGMTKQLGVSGAGAVTLWRSSPLTLINASATPLTTLNGDYAPGDAVYLKAWGGTVTLGTGGNIDASGLPLPLVVPDKAIVTLVRGDLGGTWHIAAIDTVDTVHKLTVNGALTVGGLTTLNGGLTATDGTLELTGGLAVTGALTAASLAVTGDVTVGGVSVATDTDVTAANTALTNHINDATAAHAAAAISYAGAAGLSATDVEAALDELDTEKAPKAAPTFTGTLTTVGLTASGNVSLGDTAMDLIGFYGVPGVARSAAYNLTGSADRTLGAYASDPESAAYAGVPAALADAATRAELNQLRAAYENLRTYVEDLAGVTIATATDLKALGLLG